MRECIYNIDLITNNNESISISSDYFNHFYIANIDDYGDEDNYEVIKGTNKLKANFFMMRIMSSYNKKVLERINKNRDIVGISINFTNGNIQEFEVAKKRVLSSGKLENVYQDGFYIDNDLCLIISDKKILFKEGLFV